MGRIMDRTGRIGTFCAACAKVQLIQDGGTGNRKVLVCSEGVVCDGIITGISEDKHEFSSGMMVQGDEGAICVKGGHHLI